MTQNNNSAELSNLITEALDDIKALEITVLPVSKLTSLTDYMIICSGTSNRHVHAIAYHILETAKKAGYAVKMEGEEESEWILLDLGDAIVHVMLPKTREFYNLESLWEYDPD